MGFSHFELTFPILKMVNFEYLNIKIKTHSMKRFLLLVLLIPFFTAAQCDEKKNSAFTFEFEGHTYQIVNQLFFWEEAADCARSLGGYLAEINSQAEQDTIYSAIQLSGIPSDYTNVSDGGNIAYVWIGGTDHDEEGIWVWDGDDDGESTHFFTGTYLEWEVINEQFIFWGGASEGNVDEPDDSGGQDGLGLALEDWPFGKAGEWNDIDINNSLYYVVEWGIFEPPTNASLISNTIPIELYPNPAKEQFSIKIGRHQINQLNIYNAMGQQMVFENLNKTTYDISNFAKGVYYVEVFLENGKKSVQKLMVK